MQTDVNQSRQNENDRTEHPVVPSAVDSAAHSSHIPSCGGSSLWVTTRVTNLRKSFDRKWRIFVLQLLLQVRANSRAEMPESCTTEGLLSGRNYGSLSEIFVCRTEMGFRGSRVQIPPSRSSHLAASQRLSLWGRSLISPSCYRLCYRLDAFSAPFCSLNRRGSFTTASMPAASAAVYDFSNVSRSFRPLTAAMSAQA